MPASSTKQSWKRLGRELTEMLNKTTEERVILDFRNVKFMSSSMLSKLVAVNRKPASSR